MIDASPELIEEANNTWFPWYWYTEIPEEYFINLLIPGSYFFSKTLAVDEFDLINTAKYIDSNVGSSATEILTTSVLELYKRGYVCIQVNGLKEEKNSPKLFFGKEYDKELPNKEECNLLQEYSPSFNMVVYLTEEGKAWLASVKEKYPELFKVAFTTEKPKKITVDYIPDGYVKQGIINLIDEKGKPFWKFNMIEK